LLPLGRLLAVLLDLRLLFRLLFFFLLLALLAAELVQVCGQGLGFLSLTLPHLFQRGAARGRLLFKCRSLRRSIAPGHLQEPLGDAIPKPEDQPEQQPTLPAWRRRGGLTAGLPW
jgi:hypothetical protein